MTILYLCRCNICDRTTAAYADEAALWRHVWSEGWTTVASLPEHHCPDCKQVAS